MRTTALFACIAAAFLPSLFLLSPARAQTATVQTFNSPSHGYSISVPADWQRAPDAEVTGLIARVRQSPNTQDLEWDAMYRAPAPPFATVRYPYVIFQVKPYPAGQQVTESDLQQAVSNMSNNDFVKKELSSSSDALMKQAANDSALGPAQYDSTNHLMVQDLNMNVAGAGPVRAVLFHHFGRHALVSVMCYDQKANFSRDQPVFGQIASSFKFDEGSRYDPAAAGVSPRLLLVAVLTFAIVAAVVITIVLIAIRRRPVTKGAGPGLM